MSCFQAVIFESNKPLNLELPRLAISVIMFKYHVFCNFMFKTHFMTFLSNILSVTIQIKLDLIWVDLMCFCFILIEYVIRCFWLGYYHFLVMDYKIHMVNFA